MAAVRHLGFSEVGNFNCPYPSEGQNASSSQILCKSVKALRRYGGYRFFKMAAVHHLGFLKVGNFLLPIPLVGPQCVTVPNFVQIRQGVTEIWPFSFFSRWRPSVILDFEKLEILTARALRRAKMHHLAKFCANRSRHCGDMEVFDFSRWRPSAILDLLYACLNHPRSVFWWSLSLCKIWFESVEQLR